MALGQLIRAHDPDHPFVKHKSTEENEPLYEEASPDMCFLQVVITQLTDVRLREPATSQVIIAGKAKSAINFDDFSEEGETGSDDEGSEQGDSDEGSGADGDDEGNGTSDDNEDMAMPDVYGNNN